jgi:hypothetical protein
MKLFHLPVENDQAGSELIAEKGQAIEAAGGQASLSRSFGIGSAIVVLTLPDNVSPEDLGLADAQLVGEE